MKTKYKHLVIFPIVGEPGERITNYMDTVASHAFVEPLHLKLVPHATFHSPISGMLEKHILSAVSDAATESCPGRIRFAGIDKFNNEHIVLPIQATMPVMRTWISLSRKLALYPGYIVPNNRDAITLHASIATDLDQASFRRGWSSIEKMTFEARDIVVDSLHVYRKPLSGGSWEFLRRFPFKQSNPTPV